MQRGVLIALLLVGFILRLTFGLLQPTDTDAVARALPDQGEYLQLAGNFMAGRGMVLRDERFGQDVYAYRTPGYPLFLALFGADVRRVRVAQALIDTSTALATYFIARRVLYPRAALLACALVALDPFLIYFSGLLLSETLYTALLAWGFCALVSSQINVERDRIKMGWVGLGILASSVVVRPSAVLLGPVLAAVVQLNRRPFSAYRLVAWLFVSMVSVALVLGSWASRNQRTLGSAVWLTSNGGITAYDGFNSLQLEKAWRERGGSDQTFIQSMPELARMGEIERDQYLRQSARTFMKDHLADLPGLTAAKILRTWSPVPLSADYGSRRIYVLVGLLFSLPLLILTAWGACRPVSRGGLKTGAKLVLLTPALYFTVVHALTVGSLRYRIPVEPLLAVVACSVLNRPDPAPAD